MHTKTRKYLTYFLNKTFESFASNSKINPTDYSIDLLKASQANTYIETISSRADSMHRRIELSYEESVLGAYKKVVSRLIKRFKLSKAVDLAIDFTDEPFYGKTRNFWVYDCKPEKGVKGKFKYLVLSMANREPRKKIPLLALPFHVGQYKASAIETLLKFAKSLVEIRIVLLDREFYSGAVIQKLQQLGVKYIIFIPKNQAVQRYLNEMRGLTDIREHQIKWCAFGIHRVKTNLVLLKDYVTDRIVYDWVFATNLQLKQLMKYVQIYKRRWQIETNFRVEDEAKIKSKSVHYLTRYFYFMISLLLHSLWLVLARELMPFKGFLISIYETTLFNMLGIDLIPTLGLGPP